MVYYKIKLTELHFRKVTFLTPTRIFSSFSPSVHPSSPPPQIMVHMDDQQPPDRQLNVISLKMAEATFAKLIL